MTDSRSPQEVPLPMPCPFCGSEPKTEEVKPRSGMNYWTITCFGCDGSVTVVAIGKVQRQAVDRWNRRSSPETAPRDLQILSDTVFNLLGTRDPRELAGWIAGAREEVANARAARSSEEGATATDFGERSVPEVAFILNACAKSIEDGARSMPQHPGANHASADATALRELAAQLFHLALASSPAGERLALARKAVEAGYRWRNQTIPFATEAEVSHELDCIAWRLLPENEGFPPPASASERAELDAEIAVAPAGESATATDPHGICVRYRVRDGQLEQQEYFVGGRKDWHATKLWQPDNVESERCPRLLTPERLALFAKLAASPPQEPTPASVSETATTAWEFADIARNLAEDLRKHLGSLLKPPT